MGEGALDLKGCKFIAHFRMSFLRDMKSKIYQDETQIWWLEGFCQGGVSKKHPCLMGFQLLIFSLDLYQKHPNLEMVLVFLIFQRMSY